ATKDMRELFPSCPELFQQIYHLPIPPIFFTLARFSTSGFGSSCKNFAPACLQDSEKPPICVGEMIPTPWLRTRACSRKLFARSIELKIGTVSPSVDSKA